MTKYKTAELEGALLDAAVGMAEGDALPDYWRDPEDGTCWLRPGREHWAPSSRWEQGGPIIEREVITTTSSTKNRHGGWDKWPLYWMAGYNPSISSGAQCESGWLELPELELDYENIGPTPLIAAMRAYVASKLGDEVELP